jgi:cytochrome c6|uniref:Cytochrome c-553 n=1 Tax=Ochromonas sp. CCMP1393 TaxID=420556 RepID=A0A0D3MKI5_9STRA|nr:cytochrome c6 [Ochromonas sp. CCMP1393]AIM52812.1 cytochrome c6 [Ochromonas sp. CCMP1393]
MLFSLKKIIKNVSFILVIGLNFHKVEAKNLEIGKKLFTSNCNVCHIGGKNLIIPEKSLKKEILEANGMNNLNAIIYQVINGKNGMPAFGGRLEEYEIEEIANYVLESAYKIGFEKMDY